MRDWARNTGSDFRRTASRWSGARVPGMWCMMLLALLWAGSTEANDRNHKYEDGERVIVWVNKVGPWYNPQESYPYHRLPFCVPTNNEDARKKKKSGIGEVLAGHELRNSGINVGFLVPESRELCSQTLDTQTATQFRKAVEQQYRVNIYIDDLPLYGPLGGVKVTEAGRKEAAIYVKQKYTIHYNGDRIIKVIFEQDDLQPLEPGTELTFTYEVDWKEVDTPFSKRFEHYLDPKFFEHQIHWFSIFNSFMMVIFLVGFVALILLRTLRNDFAKYTADDDDLEDPDAGLGDESGWKQVHGDVFRAPKHLIIFSALFGTGCQLGVLVFVVILFAIAGPLHGDVYEERGEIVTTFIVCYALTSFISGYTSGSYYRQFFTTPRAEQASQWQKTMLLSAVLVPSVIFPVMSYLNLVAAYHNTVNTIRFVTLFKIGLIWLFVSLPLCVAGSMFVVIPLAGVLPFGSIFIEVYFILTSLWGNEYYYYVFGFMMLVFVIMLVVVVCTTIVAVYTVLNAENYHWQWVSFLSAGSTAGYVFLYSLYYFWFRTEQSGFIQVSFYLGYMGLFCAALAVMCGSVGVIGSTVFVKQIYRNIKVD